VELPYRLIALRTATGETAEEQVLQWRQRVAALLPEFAYAAITLAGRERPLLMLTIASAAALSEATIATLALALDMPEGSLECSAYRDPRRSVVKLAQLDASTDQLLGMLLAGETAAAGWLQEVMLAAQPVGSLRRWLFAPTAKPPVAMTAGGRTICNCFGISETQITGLLGQGASLGAVQEQLKCGTSCGSCLPELRRMAAAAAH
jgi:assimilatory nitrate reductase catalytic subunit